MFTVSLKRGFRVMAERGDEGLVEGKVVRGKLRRGGGEGVVVVIFEGLRRMRLVDGEDGRSGDAVVMVIGRRNRKWPNGIIFLVGTRGGGTGAC